MNRLTTLALIVAGSFAMAAPALADFKTEQDARQAYDRLKNEVDTFVREWRSGLDNRSRSTTSESLTADSNTLWAKHVHFLGSACLTREDGLKIRDYLKEAAARKAIVTEAANATTVAMFQTDSQGIDCKDNKITGHIVLRNVRFTTVTVH